MNIYVEELDRELTTTQWEIWNGRFLNPTLCKYYQDLWKSQAPKKMVCPARKGSLEYMKAASETTLISPAPSPPPPPVVVRLPVVRPNVCDLLEHRAEYKHGCNGWMCLHGCERGHKAVPGELCQTCNDYLDSGRKFS